MNGPTPTAGLTALGFSRGQIQRARNYARSARISVPELVRQCVEENALQVAITARWDEAEKKGR